MRQMAAEDCTSLAKELSASDSTNLFCRWHGCEEGKCFKTNEEFTKHVEEAHCRHRKNGLNHPSALNGLSKDYVCLWEGCKFFKLPNSSETWFLRHIRTHTKGRPHPCFMNGCSSAFWSVSALEKHLQLHFPEGGSGHKMNREKCGEGSRGSKQKLKGSKGKGVPKNWFPESDTASVGVVSHSGLISPAHSVRIQQVAQSMSLNQLMSGSPTGNFITLTGKIVGSRKRLKVSEEDYLIEWSPPVVSQEWVPKSQVNLTKFVAFADIDRHIPYVATSFIPRPLCAKQNRKRSLPTHRQS